MSSNKQLIALIQTNGIERTERVEIKANQTVSIGRGWQNDLIVNDQYADSSHLLIKLDETGVLNVSDLNTKNGSRLNKKALKDMQAYADGAVIQIGETELRLFDSEQAVAPALPLDSAHLLSRKYSSIPVITLLTIAALAALLLYLYLFETEKFNADTAFSNVTGFVILGIAWAFIAGFISKLFRRETNISLHWVLLCVVTIAVTIFRFPIDIAKFNFDSSLANTVIDHGFYALAMCLFAYAVLSFSTRLSNSKKWVSAIVLALIPQIILAASPILKNEREQWTSQADSKRITQTPAFMWRAPKTLDQHMNKLDGLFDELEKEVQVEN